MKKSIINSKGITLTSVIIYVIGMVFVIAIISTLTSFFYKNVNIEDINKETTQYTKFSSIFLNEINKENNYIIDCKSIEENEGNISYIIFASGNQYTFMKENNSIYKNQIKICEDIQNCNFSYKFIDSEYVIKVDLKTNNMDMTEDNALKYTFKL